MKTTSSINANEDKLFVSLFLFYCKNENGKEEGKTQVDLNRKVWLLISIENLDFGIVVVLNCVILKLVVV